MKTIHVPASNAYDVLIGEGLLAEAGKQIAACTAPCKAAVMTDDTVAALYGDVLMRSLEEAGFEASLFAFPHGEGSKTMTTLSDVLEFLAAQRLSRSDIVVALGGGVVGDLAGFAAAVYLRGIRYVQIPTTLLAAVDSSVGGKTAVDLTRGKNLAGAFHQPMLVLCDPLTLRSLPDRIYREGMAEVIKYAVLLGEPFISQLENCDISEEDILATCVACKRDIVARDEFDRGDRQLLNLGHTIGHAVEACSDYTLYHGECVAIGMAAIARACVQEGICSESDCLRIYRLLQRHNLPTTTYFNAEKLCAVCCSDKKISAGSITLVLPHAPGNCELRKVPLAELRDWIAKGLALWM